MLIGGGHQTAQKGGVILGSRSKLAAILAVAAAIGTTAPIPVASAQGHAPIRAVAAKTCPHGYTRGTINGAVKCLHRGEYCTHSADHQYRHYGFRCTRRYGDGRYHLT